MKIRGVREHLSLEIYKGDNKFSPHPEGFGFCSAKLKEINSPLAQRGSDFAPQN